ncbi:hypothetical protein BJY04DRAFT_216166 [Aspergillus karnatakaensis]|uniref:uncharacterized protein n=1 Tax=Aspergillus karnatakaensis TaxID=1810916 RepID=UPI003CCCBAA2
MPHPLNLIRGVFLALGAVAFYSIWVTGAQKGLITLSRHARANGELSGTPDATLLPSFTGIFALDRGIKDVVVSFWPVCNGQYPSLSLLGVTLATTTGVSYILLALEERRKRSSLGAAWRLAWLGVLQMHLTQAAVMPIYCAFTLSFEPVTSQSPRLFRSLPWMKTCIILVYHLHVLVLTLPAPAILSYTVKQLLLAELLIWPLWMFVLFWVSSFIRPDSKRVQLERDRRAVYMLALVTTTIAHMTTLISSLLSKAPCAGCASDLRPSNVYLPSLPWTIVEFESMVDVTANFIQWDYLISNITLVLWAATVYTRDCGEKVNIPRGVLQVLGLSALTSPAGAAVIVIWRLDWILSKRRAKAD